MAFSLSSLDSFIILLAGFSAYLIRLWTNAYKRYPLPPGPKGTPLIGNLLQMPKKREWEQFAEWAHEYGPMVQLNLLGQRMVILNTFEAAKALLDGRAPIYSNRPYSVSNDLCETGWWLTQLSGEPHKVGRVMVQKYFSGTAAKKHQYIQQEEAQLLLRRLLETPDDFTEHFTCHAASVVMMAAYGYRVDSPHDPLLKELDAALSRTGSFEETTGRILAIFPFLKHYPRWLPFSGFWDEAEETKRVVRIMRYTPFNEAKENIAHGTAAPSFVSTLLDELSQSKLSAAEMAEKEGFIRDCAGTMYGAGAHSTSTAMMVYCIVAALYPEFVQNARKELDEVVGLDRLPTFGDRTHLPYIEAVFLELMRYNCVTPIGFPHLLIQDDVYEGYLLPKGTIMLSNKWLMFNDPQMFPNPDVFMPERFLGPQAHARRELLTAVWGWGRRACPGRQLAEASLFIALASVIACFDIVPAVDEKGQPIPIDVEWTPGFVRRPLPFKCSIKPRSEKARELILSGFSPAKAHENGHA